MFKHLLKPRKIELFVRHCFYSEVSSHKKRFEGFSHEKCHENLMATLDPKRVNVTFFLDTKHRGDKKHFVEKHPVIEFCEGTEAGTFLKMLDHVASKKMHPETLIYFLEDDYLHREGWIDILEEAFTLKDASYVTLYDHRDKYTLPIYDDLESKLYYTDSCHWRTTPSTTNTYAMKFKTLMEHFAIHKQFSMNRKISADHAKFCELAHIGAKLLSPIPGWSTHAEPEFATPCHNWEREFSMESV